MQKHGTAKLGSMISLFASSFQQSKKLSTGAFLIGNGWLTVGLMVQCGVGAMNSADERAAIVAWLRSNGPDRDNGGPCRHVEHAQGHCICDALADAIERGDHLKTRKAGSHDGYT